MVTVGFPLVSSERTCRVSRISERALLAQPMLDHPQTGLANEFLALKFLSFTKILKPKF